MEDGTEEQDNWRSAGLQAGRMYAEELAQPLFEEGVGTLGQQRLIGMLRDKVREDCAQFRADGVPEADVQQFGQALIESVGLRLREIASSMDGHGGDG